MLRASAKAKAENAAWRRTSELRTSFRPGRFAPKEWPTRCTRGARSPRAVKAGASRSRPTSLAHLPRAALHEPEAERVERRDAHVGTARAVARLTHERVQLDLLLGPERHLGLAQRRDQPGQRAGVATRQLPETCNKPKRSFQAPGARIRFALRERLGGPVNGHAKRDDPLAQRAERVVQMAVETLRALARLGQFVEPARAEQDGVRRGRSLLERVGPGVDQPAVAPSATGAATAGV